jgi:hypothetical protein
LEKEEIIFSLDVEKIFTSVKREAVEKEIRKLIEIQEIIRECKKEEVLENSNFVWKNTYWILE